MKKSRKSYLYLGEYTLKDKPYLFKVLMDASEILSRQEPLVKTSRFLKNRQDYGPFRVTVSLPSTPSSSSKEKRKRTQSR